MSETEVVTGKVRFSYAHVFKAHAHEEGQTAKFSVSLIIPKKDKKTIKKINDAVKVAIETGISKFSTKIQTAIKSGKALPSSFKMPLRDGDEDREDNEEYADSMFLNCSSTRKPSVINQDLGELFDENEFYSGCFGRAALNFYSFSKAGNVGIACGLNHLQKLDDGEKLGGSSMSAEEAFGDDDGLL